MDERGSITVLGVGMLALIGMAMVLLGHLGSDAVRRARAASIADAVAMAAAAEPSAGPGIAAANGATLTSLTRDGYQTEVVVRRDGATAAARAEFLPPKWWQCQSLPTGDPVHFESCPLTPVG